METQKRWWARVIDKGVSGNDYGRWVPTGCLELEAAKDYLIMYGGFVKEWLQL